MSLQLYIGTITIRIGIFTVIYRQTSVQYKIILYINNLKLQPKRFLVIEISGLQIPTVYIEDDLMYFGGQHQAN